MNAKAVFILFLVVLLVVVGILAAVIIHERRHQPTPSVLIPTPTSAPSTEVGPGPDKFWHHGDVLLPNPELSPGKVRTTDADEVCHEKAKDFRGDTLEQIYREYGVTPHQGICLDTRRMTKGGHGKPPHIVVESCEVDHIVSLELGGADDPANLFIQPYNPANGVPGAHAKDRLENWLHQQVCKHGMPLVDAQKAIRTDWYQAYLNAHLGDQ
jgi:hypothetical protein